MKQSLGAPGPFRRLEKKQILYNLLHAWHVHLAHRLAQSVLMCILLSLYSPSACKSFACMLCFLFVARM